MKSLPAYLECHQTAGRTCGIGPRWQTRTAQAETGAPERDRTDDLSLTRGVLCQLSYRGENELSCGTWDRTRESPGPEPGGFANVPHTAS